MDLLLDVNTQVYPVELGEVNFSKIELLFKVGRVHVCSFYFNESC